MLHEDAGLPGPKTIWARPSLSTESWAIGDAAPWAGADAGVPFLSADGSFVASVADAPVFPDPLVSR